MPVSPRCATVVPTLALFLLAACAMQPPVPPPEPDPPSMDRPGFQELALSIINDDANAARSALDAGADANARDPVQGSTPLIFASLLGRAEIVRMLLAAGADIHATDYNGVNALAVAELDWQSTETVAAMFRIPLTNPEAMKKGKADVAEMLRADTTDAPP